MIKLLILSFLLLIGPYIYAQNDTILYSFFTAGHTYGNPNNPHYGLHYPFVDYFPIINTYPKMELGFLTGDVVVSSTVDYWDSAMVDINSLIMPVYIAAGNHDMGIEFTNRFDYYFDFIHNDDLFIVLTPGIDSWNISGEQLEFLENSLDSNSAQVNNIFIFMHELIWWSPTNEYQDVEINYTPHYPGFTNFDEVIKPLLLSYTNKITLFAGDLGCTDQVSPFMFHSFNNITLIGSGMGGGVRDNIIITNVYSDSVYYDLISLNNSDPNFLGEIYEHAIMNSIDPFVSNEVKIYPNPTISHITIKGVYIELNVYNNLGQKVMNILDYRERIDMSKLEQGLYIVEIVKDEGSRREKLIIH